MCGIAGLIHKGKTVNIGKELQDMLQALKHRGPDASGIYVKKNLGLGHRRLSIIDTREVSNQPMHSNSKIWHLVFNGEIYGFEKIKQEYKDYPFKTNSDTELLLAMYLKHGEKMLDYLPGMFSFAIWDNRNQKLFCARDRFGEKPFFYSILNSDRILQ
mgnify:CR=1 FL=1